MSFQNYAFAGFIGLLLFSCSSNSTSDLIDDSPVDVVQYAAHIRPIISNNCISCHGNTPVLGATVSLSSNDLVRIAILEHGLLERISRPNGEPGLMPNGGQRLPQNTIDLITQWESDGFQP